MFGIIILCTLLLTQEIADARKINLGGINRGQSGARTNSAGYKPHGGYNQPQGGGYHPQQSGYHPQQGGYPPQSNYHPPPSGYHPPQSGYQPGYGHYPQSGFAPQQPRFNPGSGPGSPSSSAGTFKKALLGGALGAAGGIAAYELGKAILRSPSQPLQAPNGQSYYFDQQNHQRKDGYFMCSMPIDDVVKTLQGTSTPATTTDQSGNSTAMTPEQFFKTVQFQDGSRPKSLTWNCKIGSEICCGTECCPAPQQLAAAGASTYSSHSRGPSWVAIILGILGGIALLMCCCCCLAYKLCRSAFDMCLPSRNTENDHPAEVAYTGTPAPAAYDSTQGQPSYPEYPQQGGGYPPQYGYYPSQPYPQQQQQYY